MKRQLLMLACLGLTFTSFVAWAQDSVPAPTHKEGDTWQINIGRKAKSPVLRIGMRERTS